MELLERGEVLQALVELATRAPVDGGHVALLRGEAGIGKTAVASALTRVVAREARVLWGSCDDLLAPRPLGPVWDMATREPQLAEALRGDDQRLVRQALLDVFTRTHRPIVAVFEDVHWADGATLDLLTLVGRRIARTHTLLVLTFREAPPDHPLNVVLGDLPAERVRGFRLEPLSRGAVATLARDQDVGSQVFDQTDGNPFLVSALLSRPGGRVPATVSDLVRSLVARLTGSAERLVQLVSVVPGRVELALLEEIDPDLVRSFESTEHLGLLRMEEFTVAFRHELARTAVENSLAESLRRTLHRQVLAAGQRLGFEPARLAHHARRAADVDAMVRWLPVAAAQAASGRSHREAIAHLEALAPHLDRLLIHERADVYELWAGVELFASGAGLPHAMAAIELRRQVGDTVGVGRGLLAAARAAWVESPPSSATSGGDRAHGAHAIALARQAVTVLEDVGGEELSLAYGEVARMAAQNSDFASARKHAERALELAPGPSRGRALALATAGLVTNAESYPDGSRMLEEAADIAESLGLAWELQRARGNHIQTAIAARDLDQARRHNAVALESVDDDVVTTLFHVISGAVIDTAGGDYDAAESALRDLIDRNRLTQGLQWFAEPALAEVLVRRGDPAGDAAVDCVRRRAELHGHRTDLAWAARLSALYLWSFRRRDDARTATNIALLDDIAVDWALPWDIGELALWLWLDGHVDIVPDRAAEPVHWLGNGDWERAADWFGDRGLPFEQAVALSLGNTDARLEALRIAQHIGARALAARFRHDLRAEGITGIPRGPRAPTRQSPLGLTPRQGEVLALLADGLSNVEIAERLFISVRTVENHVSAVLATVGAASREEAVTVAAGQQRPRTTARGSDHHPARAPSSAPQPP
jgi:DNA-binding CsgD family transcriptional regulator/tetratricopeptide (TPR) repeat protein